MPRRIRFTVALLNTRGAHAAAVAPDGPPLRIWTALARAAEDALIDALFLADSPARSEERLSVADSYEPLTLLSALSQHTNSIGLIGTASTSFNEPYNVARQFASLNLISGGRVGWNAVSTSNPSAAANFGDTEWGDHGRRYRRADEFIQVVSGLWRSGAAPLNHHGDFFDVRGPLNVDVDEGTRPLISQAGGSPEGLRLGARFADLVFAIQPDAESSRRFITDIRSAAEGFGRSRTALKVFPGVVPYIGRTAAEAAAYKAELDSRLDVESLYAVTARYLHIDEAILRSFPIDGPFPVALLPAPETVGNSVASFTHLARTIEQQELSVRQAVVKASGGNRHREFVGTPEDFVADLLSWSETDAADGFTLLFPEARRGLEQFAELVVPLLRDAGVYPSADENGTLDRIRE